MNKVLITLTKSFKAMRCLNLFRNELSVFKSNHMMSASNFFRPECRRFNVLAFGICISQKNRLNILCRRYSFGYIKNFKTTCVTFRGQIHYRNFRTSPQRNIPPYMWLFIRPVFKFIAVLTGRGFRKWWRDLPPSKRKYFWGVLKKNKVRVSVTAGIIGCLCVFYYESHLQETPITKRKRFIVFTEDQCRQLADFELQALIEKEKSQILPKHHPAYTRVMGIGQRLIDANKDIKEMYNRKWNITVIESSQENAFSIPDGNVFVCTGMLDICSNNDQLACIIAHEFAHCILGHAVERASFVHFVDYIIIVILAAIWAILPSDVVALFAHWMFNQFVKVLVNLPYERNMETEADEVGIQLAAKACFDVRESSAFWAKMAIISKHDDSLPNIEFLSTHPSHEKRSSHLDSLMDEALELRKSCGCPSLRSRDPRFDIMVLSKAAEDLRRRNFQKLPLSQASPATYTPLG